MPLLVAPAAGALFDRVGARRLVIPGLIMQAAGFGAIVWLAGHGAGYPAYVAPFLLAGVGISMALPCVPAAGLNAVPAAMLGKAAGVLNTCSSSARWPGWRSLPRSSPRTAAWPARPR